MGWMKYTVGRDEFDGDPNIKEQWFLEGGDEDWTEKSPSWKTKEAAQSVADALNAAAEQEIEL